MSERTAKKLRQLARRQERKELDDELRLLPEMFKPRPKIIPKFLWKILFFTIVKKEMIKYNE